MGARRESGGGGEQSSLERSAASDLVLRTHLEPTAQLEFVKGLVTDRTHHVPGVAQGVVRAKSVGATAGHGSSI